MYPPQTFATALRSQLLMQRFISPLDVGRRQLAVANEEMISSRSVSFFREYEFPPHLSNYRDHRDRRFDERDPRARIRGWNG